MSKKLVEVNPKDFISIDLSDNSPEKVTSKISIKNLTPNYIIYKLYTTEKSLFIVKPSFSILKPNQSDSITVKSMTKDISLYQGKEIKLLLMFKESKEPISSTNQAKTFFKEKGQNKEERQDTILNIKIITDIKTDINTDTNKKKLEPKNEKNEIKKNNNDEPEKYKKIKEQLKKEGEEILKNINIQDKELLNEKQKYIKEIENAELPRNKIRKNKTVYNPRCDIIYIAIIIIFGLIIGAYLAKGFNKLFGRKKN